MKKAIIFLSFMITCRLSYSQVYLTRNGFIGFYSKTALEDIQAENNQAYAVIDGCRQAEKLV